MSIDIMRGLAYLHNRQPKCVIHRDLKPTNLLLTQSGKVKIADFGISCFQANSQEIYKMTGETGTYRYMAPEVMCAQNHTQAVDYFALGVIGYEFMIGKVFNINNNIRDHIWVNQEKKLKNKLCQDKCKLKKMISLKDGVLNLPI